MKPKTIELENIGTVQFVKSRRAKFLRISIKPFRGIRVSVPFRISYTAALDYVYKKRVWITSTLEKIGRYEREIERMEREARPVDAKNAKEVILERAAELASMNGFSYGKITIRNQKTRWGSCSARNNLSLNVRLAALPRDLMDYVILHELVHTKHHNHSREFWSELELYVRNAKATDRRLKEYPIAAFKVV